MNPPELNPRCGKPPRNCGFLRQFRGSQPGHRCLRPIRPCSSATNVAGNRLHSAQASSTRPAAVRADIRSMSPTSATAESCTCDVLAPSAALRASALRMNESIARS